MANADVTCTSGPKAVRKAAWAHKAHHLCLAAAPSIPPEILAFLIPLLVTSEFEETLPRPAAWTGYVDGLQEILKQSPGRYDSEASHFSQKSSTCWIMLALVDLSWGVWRGLTTRTCKAHTPRPDSQRLKHRVDKLATPIPIHGLQACDASWTANPKHLSQRHPMNSRVRLCDVLPGS